MVYFGPSYSDNEIKEDLARNKIVYKKMVEPVKEVSKLIFENKIVAFIPAEWSMGRELWETGL